MQVISARSSMPLLALLAIGLGIALFVDRPWAVAETAPPAAAPAATPLAAPKTVRAPEPSDGILRAGLESRHVFDGGDGVAHLGILVRPPADATAQRQPVAVSLVIDSSTSMEGLKIEHARHAARAIVDGLADGDQLSIVDYDSDARVLVPLTRLDAASRPGIRARIDAVVDDGWTALFGGVEAGLSTLVGVEGATRRVMLLSDGQANVGPKTPAAIVAGLSPDGVTISSIGIGTDYDAAVMTAVADLGQGRLHHLTDPVQLAGILETELQAARTVVGRVAVVDIELAEGVELIEVAGMKTERTGSRTHRVFIGDLYGGETRALSARVRVPLEGARAGLIGAVKLAYEPMSGPQIARAVSVPYSLAASLAEVEKAQIPTYMIAADRMRVSHVLLDAAALLEEGDLVEAQALMRDERARLAKRRARLDADRKIEIDGLIALFRDPYVDADLAGARGAATTTDLPALVERIRAGQAIADADLAGLDAAQLRIARNTAYARHGYRFKSADLRTFFGGHDWYRPDAGFDPGLLTPVDVDLVTRVKRFEGRVSMVAAARPTTAAPGPGFDAVFDRVRVGQPITPADLSGLDLVALRRLRNTAYARHGYSFRSSDLRDFFGRSGWYRPDPGYDPSRLTTGDAGNVRHIKAREQSLVARADAEAVRDLTLRSRARARQVVR